jgi:cob(I)alamin adenosyltransferase
MSDCLTTRQRQTLAGRQVLAGQFSSQEAKIEHYRALGRRSAERRVVLTGTEAATVAEALRLLSRVSGKFEGVSHEA